MQISVRARLGRLLLFSLSLALASAPAVAGVPEWPQAHGDLPADPAVRFGVLPNGMRYAIMRNQTPKKVVSIRFRFDVGSLDERDDERGLAHLLEHMNFRGSTHVPEADVWPGLQRFGVAVGADASAYTQETQTFYLIDLPENGPEAIDFGLMRMRETASELTIDPKALDVERGPVLSEERLRDTPDLRALMAQRAYYFQGMRLADHAPIGKTDIVEHAPASQIRAFYQAWYRPERATLIVVGDVDPDAVEARIKARFWDWTATAPARPEPSPGLAAAHGANARIVVDPRMSRSIEIGWVAPYGGPVTDRASLRRETLQSIAFDIVNRRFRSIVNGPAPPFTDASLSQRDYGRSARLTLLSLDDSPRRWRSALEAADTVRRQALTYGVTQDEVDLEVRQLRAHYQAIADGAATRNSTALAQAIMRSVDEGRVFVSPAELRARFDEDTKALTAQEVSAALRGAFDGAGPLVFISSPAPIEGGEPAVMTEWARIEAEPVSKPAPVVQAAWPYENFGPAGAVAARGHVADLDLTTVRFKNGVNLTIKPTKFAANQVMVGVSVGHGLLDLPVDRSSLRWLAESGAFISGGLGRLAVDGVQRALAGRIYSVGFNIADDHTELSGVTRQQDLAVQLQLITAYLTDPGLRPEAFERVRGLAGPTINNQNASPTGVLSRQLSFLLHDGDPRWASPTQVDVAAAQPAELKRMLADLLGGAPIEVTIVGDVDVDQAIAAVATTLGALPPRHASEPEAAEAEVQFPEARSSALVRRHAGRDDQALFLIAWPVPDARGDMLAPRELRILEQTLKSRLFNAFRVAEGAGYEADTYLETSQTFPGYGYLIAFAEAPPDKQRLFYDTVDRITADLRETRIGPDELERARQPRVELFEKAQQTNSFWLNGLTGASRAPRRLDLLRTTIPDLKRVSADQVQRLAMSYLVDDRAWRLAIEPKSRAGVAPQKSTGIATLDCARSGDAKLSDCRVVKESPPGLGVGATALTLAPTLKLDAKAGSVTQDGRVQFDLRVAPPDLDP